MLYRKITSSVAIGVTMLIAGGGAALAEVPTSGTPSQPTSDGGVVPYTISGTNPGGNRTCGEVGFAYFSDANYYQCYSGRINAPLGPTSNFGDVSGNADCDQVPNITASGGTGPVSFTAIPDGLGALIVKGSAQANTYVYEPQATSDSGLEPPINASGGSAALSNLTVCWNPDGSSQPCLEYETAWAAIGVGQQRYTTRGNWATYITYDQCVAGVDLFAGQFMLAGEVSCTPETDGSVTVTVNLDSGWQFANLPTEEDGIFDDNLKVQDYSSIPTGNPAPGQFMWKTYVTGSSGSVSAATNKYYGVHVDVAKVVACSPE
jgi:hypothetical protein